jgi:hypothetical protein
MTGVRFEGVAEVNETEINLCVFPGYRCVVGCHVGFVVEIEVPFEPLYELEIVLVASLAELLYVDILLDFALGEPLLEDLVVGNELPFVARTPVDPA